jgi:broad specificity phosphatase PhoE
MGDITTVHVMRHGAVYNPGGILYGRLDGYHLSDTGRAQAQKVADWLADRDIVLVVASPLQRAQETAAPVAARHNLSAQTDDDLIESLNVFEGQRVSPGDGALHDPRNWWYLRNPFKPSWGEPYKDIALRMTTAVEKARAKAAGHEAVCVSHQLPIEILRRALTGRRLPHDPRKRQCGLASLNSFVFDDGALVGWHYQEPASQ